MQKLLKGVNGLVSFASAFLQKFDSVRQTHKFDFIFFTLRKFLLCRSCEFWFNDYGSVIKRVKITELCNLSPQELVNIEMS